MRIVYDPKKSETNIAERGLSFARAAEFAFDTAVFIEDGRRDYPETRIVATGYLDDRLHVLCFTSTEDGIRVISFRKANAREVRDYAKATADG